MEDDAIRLHYNIDAGDFAAAGTASSSTKRLLGQLGIDPSAIKRVAIAMYEAEMNVVIHANGGYADVEITPEYITVVVKDEGPGIPDLEKAMQAGWSTAGSDIRSKGFGAGMGLPNMKSQADDLKIETEVGKGTKVTLVTRISEEYR